MTRPLHTPLRHSESTRHYTKHVNFAEPPREVVEDVLRGRYDVYGTAKKVHHSSAPTVATVEEFGYSTLSTPECSSSEKQEESDMEYYTSSETGSQETVKFKPKTEVTHIVAGGQNKPGIQIVVQTPVEGEAEKREEFVENLYAEIDLKIQPAKLEKKEAKKAEDVPPALPAKIGIGGPAKLVEETIAETVNSEPKGVLMEMREFESKLEEIIKSTEEVFIMNAKDHHPSSLENSEKPTPPKMPSKEEKIADGGEQKEVVKETEVVIPPTKPMEQAHKEEPVYIPKPPARPPEDKWITQQAKTMDRMSIDPKVTGKPPKPPQSPKCYKVIRADIPRFPEKLNETTEQTFYEEEYSYEPELKRSSTKVVLRTRSLVNLDEDINSGFNSNTIGRLAGPNRNKITTGPDGTFRFAGRKASSEMNLSDESNASSTNSSPKAIRYFSGEELKKRKEEIFKEKPKPPQNINKYNEEINSNSKETTKERAINNLKRYLKENNIGLREILVNNNVVIIEPIRSEKPVYDVSEYNHKNAGDLENGCRITGATVKPESAKPTAESNTLPRVSKPYQTTVQRHFFYHPLVKPNKMLKDEELPDPDKVRKNRQMFQNIVKFARTEDSILMLPISAKWYSSSSDKNSKPRITPEVRVIENNVKPSNKERVKKENSSDNEGRQDSYNKRNLNKKWTDTGSLSSGVSSDMSCFDNEFDSNNMDDTSSNKEIFSSEEDEGQEFYTQELDTHPVSPEVLKKIRACGTSVTYYGGRVIAHSNGPIRSPMTMTIMDEIRQTGSAEESRRYTRGDQYMGVKFRLVKSNSCGSRLELAGTDDGHEISKIRFHEDIYGPAKTLSEELAECRGKMDPIQDKEEREETVKSFNKVQSVFEDKSMKADKKPMQSWRALIESRKQNRAVENHRPCPDMEFEEFQVIEG